MKVIQATLYRDRGIIWSRINKNGIGSREAAWGKTAISRAMIAACFCYVQKDTLNTNPSAKKSIHDKCHILTSKEICQTLLCLHNSKAIYFFFKPKLAYT